MPIRLPLSSPRVPMRQRGARRILRKPGDWRPEAANAAAGDGAALRLLRRPPAKFMNSLTIQRPDDWHVPLCGAGAPRLLRRTSAAPP
jgi:hypothetical protein